MYQNSNQSSTTLQHEKGTVSSIEKALRILDCFSVSKPELSLTQISQQLNIPKTTILNQLRTLENAGFIYKVVNTQNYRLGYKLMDLSYRAHAALPIIPYAIPLMERISSNCNENVYLTTHINGQVFFLKCLHANTKSINYSVSGKTLPMHCTSCGKAMLSYMPKEETESILRTHGMPPITHNTCTDYNQFMSELAQARERGYAIDNEEESIGGRCVAVAVRTSTGLVAGALSISGSVITMTDDKIPAYVNMLQIASHELTPHASLFPAIQLRHS